MKYLYTIKARQGKTPKTNSNAGNNKQRTEARSCWT